MPRCGSDGVAALDRVASDQPLADRTNAPVSTTPRCGTALLVGQPTAVAAPSSVAAAVAGREARSGRATGATATSDTTFKPRRRLDARKGGRRTGGRRWPPLCANGATGTNGPSPVNAAATTRPQTAATGVVGGCPRTRLGTEVNGRAVNTRRVGRAGGPAARRVAKARPHPFDVRPFQLHWLSLQSIVHVTRGGPQVWSAEREVARAEKISTHVLFRDAAHLVARADRRARLRPCPSAGAGVQRTQDASSLFTRTTSVVAVFRRAKPEDAGCITIGKQKLGTSQCTRLKLLFGAMPRRGPQDGHFGWQSRARKLGPPGLWPWNSLLRFRPYLHARSRPVLSPVDRERRWTLCVGRGGWLRGRAKPSTRCRQGGPRARASKPPWRDTELSVLSCFPRLQTGSLCAWRMHGGRGLPDSRGHGGPLLVSAAAGRVDD